MFERYSERARRALFHTRYEMTALGGSAIEPAHVLLGLLRDSKGGIDRLLAHWSIPLGELRLQIEQGMTRGARIPTSVEVPFADATQRVLNLAAEEADRLLQYHIEPEHLLLALLREDDPVAAASLKAYGMSPDGTREYLASRSPAAVPEQDMEVLSSVSPLVAAHFERITLLVRELAQAESDSEEGRLLVSRIDEELMMLHELLKQ